MFSRDELKQHLLENEKVIASMKTGELDDAKLSTLIDQAYKQTRSPCEQILMKYARDLFWVSNLRAFREETINTLENHVLSNLNPNQATPKP